MAASDTQLECSAIVDVGFPAHPEFVTESRGSKFSRGQGLPGRVWANHQTAWIWDVTQDANFPRAEVAQQEGLQGTLGVPILSGQALVGVMEFFSAEPIATNQEFLVTIQVISNRIEQQLQRKTAERQLLAHQQALKRSNQELLVARDHAAARAKFHFLSTTSHEIRTPLNGIIGLTEILLADTTFHSLPASAVR